MVESGTLPKVKLHLPDCYSCVKGKFKRFFRGSLTKATEPGHIHADLVGRINPRSQEGHDYFLTIVDEATRYAETIPLHNKSDASGALYEFMNRFERQAGVKLLGLHTDDGSEFYKSRKKFEEMGVKVTVSTAYTPSSNGLVERTQGVLISATRFCLSQEKLPLTFWQHALEHVSKRRNVIVHSSTGKSPYTALFGTYPDYIGHMRPFGCRVLVQPVKGKLAKFERRLTEGVCLGHVDGGIYKMLISTGIIKTKHVRFFECEYPGTTLLNMDYVSEGQVLEVDGYTTEDNDYTESSTVEHPVVSMQAEVEHSSVEINYEQDPSMFPQGAQLTDEQL